MKLVRLVASFAVLASTAVAACSSDLTTPVQASEDAGTQTCELQVALRGCASEDAGEDAGTQKCDDWGVRSLSRDERVREITAVCQDCSNGIRRYLNRGAGVWLHEVDIDGGRVVCADQCYVNPVSSRICTFGTRGCVSEHPSNTTTEEK